VITEVFSSIPVAVRSAWVTDPGGHRLQFGQPPG
jgi:hypothetical protein